ncbi:hypothetical protein K435DRAFT_685004, partial [Dendrothele bispora CBS 962.96]
SDITLQSSNRILFKVHRRNLEMYSQVFADAASAIATYTYPNPPPHVLIYHMYLQPQPDLRKVDFDLVKDLAEAVEKYSAMGALNVQMTWVINPLSGLYLLLIPKTT